MPESLNAPGANASPPQGILLAGVPAVVIALGVAGVIYAGFSGGGSAKAKQEVLAATQSPSTPTPSRRPRRLHRRRSPPEPPRERGPAG